MTSRRKRVRKLLRWDRWIAHYPPDIKATPACVRAYERANELRPDDECLCAEDVNPYAGLYGQLILADAQRYGWDW